MQSIFPSLARAKKVNSFSPRSLGNKNSIITAVVISLAFCLAGPIAAFAATAPNLGTAASFAVLGNSTVTNTGSSVLNGDLGLYPGTSITGFFGTTANEGPGVVSAGHSVHQTDATAQQAQTDTTAAYSTLSGQSCGGNDLSGQDLGGMTLVPGVYCFTSSAQLTGTLTLNAQGDPNAVWVFQIGTALTTASSSSVVFSNGGTGTPGCNVFWQVGSAATLGGSTTFVGTIIAHTEAITFVTGATLYGRALSSTAAVTLDSNTITTPTCAPAPVNGTCGLANGTSVSVAPTSNLCSTGSATSVTGSGPWTWSCTGANGGTNSSTCTATVTPSTTLTLVKTIVGGTKTFADFPLTATGPTTITGDSATTAVTAATVSAGTYTLSETTQSNYTAGSWSCIKDPGSVVTTGTSITLASGDGAICTITNTYVAPAAPSGGGGGNSYGISTPIAPLIDVVKVPSPLSLPGGAGSVTYTYTLHNPGTVSMNKITVIDDSCSPLKYISGDTFADLRLDPSETWTYTCSATLSKTTTNTVVATGWAYGVSATHIATATVIVGLPIVPPLIHVTKIPNLLTLTAAGGIITYTNKVTNPGTVPLSNVILTDDKCGPVKYVSGDTNGDSKLNPTETWTYTCQTNLIKTTTNTIIASGQANGLTARDFAIATVVLSAPVFPNTGLPDASGFGQRVRAIANDLRQGSGGNNVTLLQQFLISQDKGPAAKALSNHGTTTYFGLLTRAALAEFQANVGISPALGNFGPITRAYLKANY